MDKKPLGKNWISPCKKKNSTKRNNLVKKDNMHQYSTWKFRNAFNKFQAFFVQEFEIVVDSWQFIMLLRYILWDDWPIFMISDSN